MTATVTEKQYRLLIGGEWVEGSGGTYDIVNPATEDVVAPAPEASAGDVFAAAAAAKRAARAGTHPRPPGRARLLHARPRHRAPPPPRRSAAARHRRDRRDPLRRIATAGAAGRGPIRALRAWSAAE